MKQQIQNSINELNYRIKINQRVINRDTEELVKMISDNREREMWWGRIISKRTSRIKELQEAIKWEKFIYYCNTGKHFDEV